MAYRVKPRAQADIEAIGNYISDRNPPAATKLIAKLVEQWELLATQPYSGAGRSDILPGIRHKVMGQYVAFYHVDGRDVVILRVLHGKQKISSDDFGG
jgi:toxin ParE1/3/4